MIDALLKKRPRVAFAYWTVGVLLMVAVTIRSVIANEAWLTLVATLLVVLDVSMAKRAAPEAGVQCLLKRGHAWRFEYDSPAGAVNVSTPAYPIIGNATERAHEVLKESQVDLDSLTLLDVACSVCGARPDPASIPTR